MSAKGRSASGGKKAKLLLILFFSFWFLALPLNSYSAAEIQDQNDGCAAPTGGDSLSDVAKFPMYQVFAPSLNRLTKVRLLFGGANTPTITLTVKDMSGNQIGQTSAVVSAGWVDFTFASALSLTHGLSYQIHLTREASALVIWDYCQPGGYGGGYAVTGGSVIPDKDYNFQTYGYSQQPAVSSQLPATIEPATNLKAEDVADDTGGKIKLIWAKSGTSGIDGYRVFRHSQTNSEYKQIIEVLAKNLEYEDSGLENSQEYIYIVRAYKGDLESVDSNEARAKAENNLAPKFPSNLHVVSKDKNYIELSWDKVDDERLDKYIIRYGESPIDFQTEKEVSKDSSNFRADNLKPDTRYYFRIASKSSDGEVSGFSDFISEMTDKEKQGISWVWILSIIVVILAGFGIYLYFAYQKKWWPFRAKVKPTTAKVSPLQTDEEIKELPGKKAKW